MHPAADSWDAPLVSRAARLLPLSSGLRHPTTSAPKATGGGGREVSLTSFTCHLLPPSTVPELLPWTASVTLHQPCMPLSRSGCPAEQSRAQQPWGLGTMSPLPAKATPKGSSFASVPRGAWTVVTIPPPVFPHGVPNCLLTPETLQHC